MTTAEGISYIPPVHIQQEKQVPAVYLTAQQSIQPLSQTQRRPISYVLWEWTISGTICCISAYFSYLLWFTLTPTFQAIVYPRESILYNGAFYSPITLVTKKIELQDKTPFTVVSHELIREIPPSIQNLDIDTLIIDNNPITEIPDTIGDISTLKYLGVTNTQLRSLPSSIGNNTNLVDMALSGNKLSSLPETIGSLQNLEVLTLAYNNLSSLPQSLQSLTNLKILDLTGNKLTKFPTTLPPNLEHLYIGNNHIPPKELEAALYRYALTDLIIFY